MKPPNWKEEELILTLELYFSYEISDLKKISSKSLKVIELSNILRALTIHDKRFRQLDKFRNPSGVHMKLMNFLGSDPLYGKQALRNGSLLEKKVWDFYSENKNKLAVEAERIRKKFLPSDSDFSEVLAENSGKYETNISQNNDLFFIYKKINLILEDSVSELVKLESLYSVLRQQAIQINSINESQKAINDNYTQILKITDWQKNIQILISQISKEMIISNTSLEKTKKKKVIAPKKGKAINRAKGETKVGELVRFKLAKLFSEERLSNNNISEMMDKNWSKEVLHLGHPLLKLYNKRIDLKEQTSIGSYQRYWNAVYKYKGIDYLVCKEWFETNRKHLNIWLACFNEAEAGSGLASTIKGNSLVGDLSFTTPKQIELFGELYIVNSWKKALVCVCEIMINLKPNIVISFDKNEKFKGKTRLYFNTDPEKLTNVAKKLSNGLYVETNMNSNEIWKQIISIIEQCGFKSDIITIKLGSKNIKPKKQNIKTKKNKKIVKQELIKFDAQFGGIILDVEIIILILKTIKELDSHDIFVDSKKLVSLTSESILTKTKYKQPKLLINHFLKFLLKTGIIMPFIDQESGNYVIEDYDAIHRLIEKPKLIIKQLQKIGA